MQAIPGSTIVQSQVIRMVGGMIGHFTTVFEHGYTTKVESRRKVDIYIRYGDVHGTINRAVNSTASVERPLSNFWRTIIILYISLLSTDILRTLQLTSDQCHNVTIINSYKNRRQ